METTVDDRPQHMQALGRANWVRLKRAETKREIGVGDVTVESLLLDPPEWIETCPVIDLLEAQRRWGKTRAQKFLTWHQVSHGKEVGQLTQRQAKELSDRLAGRVMDVTE